MSWTSARSMKILPTIQTLPKPWAGRCWTTRPSVAANKLPGIRAAVCHDSYSAHQGVEHDDMNVLVLGSRIIGSKLAEDLVKAFLGAKFTNEERHVRRLNKVKTLEAKFAAGLKT